MDNWDDDDFEPTIPTTKVVSDKWEGEDEEEELKDNWDDEGEEEKPKEVTPKPELKKGGKKYLQQKLKEKEAERKKEEEEIRLKEEMKTPAEKMADRLLAQKLSEESELDMLKGQFSAPEIDPEKVTIDSFSPKTKEDFIKFTKLVQDKFSYLEESPHYFYLLETVINSSVVALEPDQLKKLSTSLSSIASEKLKMEKQKKGGKKSQKVKLGGGFKSSKTDAMDDFSQYNDFDDFM